MIELLEARIAPASVVTIHTLAGSGPGSLVDAIEHASPGETIKLARNLHGALSWTSEIGIASDLTIIGNGRVTLTGDESAGLLSIDSSNLSVTLKHLSFTNGSSGTQGGGAIFSNGNLTLVDCNFHDNYSSGNGGAVEENEGTLTIKSCQFKINGTVGSGSGGAVYGGKGATVIINHSVFGLNTSANNGGALDVAGMGNEAVNLSVTGSKFGGNGARLEGALNAATDGTVLITTSTFENNRASLNVGAIAITSTHSPSLSITHCVIENNQAAGLAGGLDLYGGAILVKSCTITDNEANGGNGGGLEVDRGTVTLTKDSITGNYSSASGGGLYVVAGGTAVLDQSLVKHNSAETSGGGVAYENGAVFNEEGGTVVSKNTAPDGPDIISLD